MPINMNDFVFHSSRIPFGAIETKEVDVQLGGSVPVGGNGRIVQSELIPYTGKSNIYARVVFQIMSGSFTMNPYTGEPTTVGSRFINSGLFYRASPYPNLREIRCWPKVWYEEGGIRVGFRMDVYFSGTNPGSVTMPPATIRFTVSLDVIPENIE